jgi:hypothetical protein
MRDHQNYVCGTARPDLTKDFKTLLSTYDAGSACNPVVPYVCRQTSTMVDKASKGKGISKRERLWSDDWSRRSLRAPSGSRRRRKSFLLSLREREREIGKRHKQKRCRGSGLPSARQPKSETRPTSVARPKLSLTPCSSRLLVVLKLCKIAWFVLSPPTLLSLCWK